MPAGAVPVSSDSIGLLQETIKTHAVTVETAAHTLLIITPNFSYFYRLIFV
jgi:hypothetical protein